jgi:hypothetical protein
METKVQAQDLRVGDYLPVTKSTVVGVYRSGLRLPSGKVQIVLETTRGRRTATWGKWTAISVVRNEDVEPWESGPDAYRHTS